MRPTNRTQIAQVKNLPLHEPRCRGSDPRTSANCSQRNACARHRQLARDRDLELPEYVTVKVMNLPYVPGNACTYQRSEVAA